MSLSIGKTYQVGSVQIIAVLRRSEQVLVHATTAKHGVKHGKPKQTRSGQ